MELFILGSLAALVGLGVGAFLGHNLGVFKANQLFAAAKTGLSADEQKLLDLFRKGKAPSAPAGGTAAPATATVTIAAGTTTAPPTS